MFLCDLQPSAWSLRQQKNSFGWVGDCLVAYRRAKLQRNLDGTRLSMLCASFFEMFSVKKIDKRHQQKIILRDMLQRRLRRKEKKLTISSAILCLRLRTSLWNSSALARIFSSNSFTCGCISGSGVPCNSGFKSRRLSVARLPCV